MTCEWSRCMHGLWLQHSWGRSSLGHGSRGPLRRTRWRYGSRARPCGGAAVHGRTRFSHRPRWRGHRVSQYVVGGRHARVRVVRARTRRACQGAPIREEVPTAPSGMRSVELSPSIARAAGIRRTPRPRRRGRATPRRNQGVAIRGRSCRARCGHLRVATWHRPRALGWPSIGARRCQLVHADRFEATCSVREAASRATRAGHCVLPSAPSRRSRRGHRAENAKSRSHSLTDRASGSRRPTRSSQAAIRVGGSCVRSLPRLRRRLSGVTSALGHVSQA